MESRNGSCLCGAVRYTIDGPCRDIIACHCRQCRKASGHFSAATATRPESLNIGATESLRWYRSSAQAQRGFCAQCGSSLFWKPDSGDRISVYVGSLEGDTGLRLRAHIFGAEKGDYYTIESEQEQHALGEAKLHLDA